MPNIGLSALQQVAHVLDGVVDGGRIAGAVAEEDAVDVRGQHLLRRRRRRHDVHLAAVAGEAAQDVPLDPEVVGGDAKRPLRPASAAAARDRLAPRRPASSMPAGQSNGDAHVTSRTRSVPSMCGIARACSTSSPASTSPVAMTPRMTPAERSSRVSSRVSMSAMATTLLAMR